MRFFDEKITLIVPCFNEQEVLPFFYDEATAVMQQLDYEYELLFINDGSKDETLRVLKEFACEDDHVRYLSFSRNFGKEAGMYAGFCHADGDYVAVMDADMQEPPDLLPEMLKILESGEYDSVATRRVSRDGEPPIRSWFARRFYSLINKISDADIVDGARDFRLMRREMVDAIVAMGETNRFSKGIFGWIGFHTYWLPYENRERVAGATKRSLVKYAIDGIINWRGGLLPFASSSSLAGFSCFAWVSWDSILRRIIRKASTDRTISLQKPTNLAWRICGPGHQQLSRGHAVDFRRRYPASLRILKKNSLQKARCEGNCSGLKFCTI